MKECDTSQVNNVGQKKTKTVASYPGPFEKSEKKAWYPLFTHVLN